MERKATFEQAWQIAATAPIHMTKAEGELLYNSVSPGQIVVEIGCAQGGSTVLLLAAGGVVTCIDPLGYLGSPKMIERVVAAGHSSKSTSFNLFRNTIKRAGYGEPTLHRTFDYKVTPFVHDIIFLDSDHVFESTKRSLEIWLPFLRDKALFHDFHCHGVYQPVLDCGLQVMDRVDNLVWCKALDKQLKRCIIDGYEGLTGIGIPARLKPLRLGVRLPWPLLNSTHGA